MSDCQESDFTILSVDTFPVPWYVKLFYKETNNFYVREKGSEILTGRNPETVKAAWIKQNIDFELVTKVSRIIAKWSEWPNNLFVPDDKCSILFQETDTEMTMVETFLQIEKEIVPLNPRALSNFGSMSYGELIRYIQTELNNSRQVQNEAL